MQIARGPIYEIELTGERIVWCRVWRDPNVDEDTGAKCAAEMLEHIEREALAPTSSNVGFVFDVREGPPAFGPRTEASLTRLFTLARDSECPSSVVVGKAMQELQYGRLCRETSPDWMFVTRHPELAREYVTRPRES